LPPLLLLVPLLTPPLLWLVQILSAARVTPADALLLAGCHKAVNRETSVAAQATATSLLRLSPTPLLLRRLLLAAAGSCCLLLPGCGRSCPGVQSG
jgi:hypothetical protein